jgi:hypothetical protein
LGRWPIRVAEAGTYLIEVRRWPRELQAPLAGTPSDTKVVDAWLDGSPVSGTLYRGVPRALPVGRVELKIAGHEQTAAVASADIVKVFTVSVAAGPTDIEATLLDQDGKPLCSAFYVSISKTMEPK